MEFPSAMWSGSLRQQTTLYSCKPITTLKSCRLIVCHWPNWYTRQVPLKYIRYYMALYRVKTQIRGSSPKRVRNTADWTTYPYWLSMGEKVTIRCRSKKQRRFGHCSYTRMREPCNLISSSQTCRRFSQDSLRMYRSSMTLRRSTLYSRRFRTRLWTKSKHHYRSLIIWTKPTQWPTTLLKTFWRQRTQV